MKNKQKISGLLCVILLAGVLGGCGSKTKRDETNTTAQQQPATDGNTSTGTITPGSDANTTTETTDVNSGGSGTHTADNGSETNTTTVVTPLAGSLKLTIEKQRLNRGQKSSLKVIVKYDDNTTEDVTERVEWVTDGKGVVNIQNHTLTAKQDRAVKLRAKLGKKVSNEIILDIYWEVDGYTLPPEPDPQVNDETLGGIDANGNGVRDDVERKIYDKFLVKLQRALLMDGARVFQEIMVKPVEEAKNIQKRVSKFIDCDIHLDHVTKYTLFDKNFLSTKELEYLVISSKKRVRKYLDYNLALSGGTYGSSPSDWNRDACSEHVKSTLEEMGL